MVAVGVEPPALPSRAGLAARLAARGITRRRVSAKRSWPPGCGRFPAPAAADDGQKAADGEADEAVTAAGVPPVAQNGDLPPQGQNKVEMSVAPAAAVSPAVQNGALPEEGQNKAEEAADAGAVKCNGVVQHTLPHQKPDQVREGDRGENSKVRSLVNDTDMVSFDAEDRNRAVQVAVPTVAVTESDIVGASSSLRNGGEGVAHRGMNGDVARDEAAGDADVRENGNKPGGGELESKVDGVEGRRKRWLTSALNPPPKRRPVSAVRKFPPGCGRTTVATKDSADLEVSPVRTLSSGDEGGAVAIDDRADEAVAAAGIRPAVQNGTLPPQEQDKVEVVVAPATAESPVVQNGALPEQGQNKAEEAAAARYVLPVKCNGIVQHTLPQQKPEHVREGDRGENSKVGSLINGMASLDGQDGNREMKVTVPVVAVPESDIDGELEKKVDGVEGRRKRLLTSALNPPPRRRPVSTVHDFPPGCGRTAVATKDSADLEVSPVPTLPPGGERAAVATDVSVILEGSPMSTFSPASGDSPATTDDIAVLEVLPIRTCPPGCGIASVTTIGSGDEERTQLGATNISNRDAHAVEALTAVPGTGGAANVKVEGKRVVEKRSTNEHKKIQDSRVASDTFPVDLVGAKLDNDQPPNVVTKASPKHGFAEKMKGNLPPHEGKNVAQVVGEDKVRSNLDGSLWKDNFKTPTSCPIDANRKGMTSDGDKMDAMQKKTLSTKKESTPSNVSMKKDKFAHKNGKLLTTNQIGENNVTDIPEPIIVQALMTPDNYPLRKGMKSLASACKSGAPRKKLK